MLQAANSDLLTLVVPKAHNIVSVKIYHFLLRI